MLPTALDSHPDNITQVLEEITHFFSLRQKEVAKIVQCGEHYSYSIEGRGPPRGGLKFLEGFDESLREAMVQ
jgi:hypothetical protein